MFANKKKVDAIGQRVLFHNVLRNFPLQPRRVDRAPAAFRNPIMKGFWDSNRDMVPDSFDCKPFNWKRQGDNVQEYRCVGYVESNTGKKMHACGPSPAVWYKPTTQPSPGISHGLCPQCSAAAKADLHQYFQSRKKE
jgi:hypothetical protein